MTQMPPATQLNVAAPRIDYLPRPAWRELPDDVLFAVTFGDTAAPAGGALWEPSEHHAARAERIFSWIAANRGNCGFMTVLPCRGRGC